MLSDDVSQRASCDGEKQKKFIFFEITGGIFIFANHSSGGNKVRLRAMISHEDDSPSRAYFSIIQLPIQPAFVY